MKNAKGVILAGGTGTRLWPVTRAISKQLIPIYDKPMIYYPIASLMELGISEILIITTPAHLSAFKELLGDGRQLGLDIQFETQANPDGLAQALVIGEDFLDGAPSVLVLGDNLFHGGGLLGTMNEALFAVTAGNGASILATEVQDPAAYGVIELDHANKPIRIVEKPAKFISKWAIPGIYFFDGSASTRAKKIHKSPRGEYEITDLLQSFLEESKLAVFKMDRETVWLDTGTTDSMVEASEYVRVIETRRGTKIGCIEEIAWRRGWIDSLQLRMLADNMGKSTYGRYLAMLVESH